MAPRIAVPDTADALRETLLDRNKMQSLLSDPVAFADLMEQSVNARLATDPGITDQVGEQTEKFMRNWLRENSVSDSLAKRLNLDNPNTKASRMRPQSLYNKSAAGAKYDSYFNTVSEMLTAISSRTVKDADLSRKLGTLSNDLGSIKPSDGGFLIPEVLRAEILRVALETAIVRSRARVIPMDSLTVPFPTVDSTSNVSSVYGGIVGYWTEEGATLTESQPRFGRIELRAQKLTIYTEVPNELAYDAVPALNAFIGDMFPEAIAWFEDVGFFVGLGTGEPLGFLNAPAQIKFTRTNANHIQWPDVVGMYSRMLPQSLNRAVWICSPDVLPELYSMTFPTVSGTAAAIMGGGLNVTGTNTPPMTILGLPVIVSEKARKLGTSGDFNLVDFGFYLVGDRQAMSARQSEDFRFQNDITAYRVIERVDGRPWLQAPITPQNNSANTLSPFVTVS
jgi:HK97 family phage major capsid protein